MRLLNIKMILFPGPPQPVKVKLDAASPKDLMVRDIESAKQKIFKELRDLLEADQRLVLNRQTYDPQDVLDPVQKLHQVRMTYFLLNRHFCHFEQKSSPDELYCFL